MQKIKEKIFRKIVNWTDSDAKWNKYKRFWYSPHTKNEIHIFIRGKGKPVVITYD